jgi:hypothetical protein
LLFWWGSCFQYFLPFGKESINNLIEQAILDADKMGVKVLALGALNKVWKPHFIAPKFLFIDSLAQCAGNPSEDVAKNVNIYNPIL